MKQKSLKKTMSISQCIPQKSIKIWKKKSDFFRKKYNWVASFSIEEER